MPVNVLLVDDDPDLLVIGKEFLEEDPEIAVRTSLSAEDAQLKVAAQPVDVIVCDYRMPPGMDSIGLIRALKAQGISIPLIVFSGSAREDHAIEALNNGAAFYLQKSSRPDVHYAEMKKMVHFLHSHKKAERELAEARKEMELFSYYVSHDLRAPVRIIDSYCAILSNKLGANLPPDTQDHLIRLRAATSRMNAYFEDLLLLSRAGRSPMKEETVNLSDLVISVLGDLEHPVEGPLFMQEIEKGVMVQGDRALLEGAMRQILDNACKYAKNRPQVRIVFGSKQADGKQVIFVKDNGEGFDMAGATDLFSPFMRFHPESQFPGTGIGLAIVRKIISRHEGGLWLESSPEGGTTVFFSLHSNGIRSIGGG